METTAWPLVDPHDDGIRPAGRPDECFYCKRRVGHPHMRDCNIVEKRVELRVTATLPTGELFVGRWELDEPYFWSVQQTEFHKNDSSWCAGNVLRGHCRAGITWEAGDRVWAALEALYAGGNCLCGGELVFTFVRVIDATPRRKLTAKGLVS